MLKFICHLTPPCSFYDPVKGLILNQFSLFSISFSRCDPVSLAVHSETILVLDNFLHSLDHAAFKQLMVLSANEECLL